MFVESEFHAVLAVAFAFFVEEIQGVLQYLNLLPVFHLDRSRNVDNCRKIQTESSVQKKVCYFEGYY